MNAIFSHIGRSFSRAYLILALITVVVLFSFRAAGLADDQRMLHVLSGDAAAFRLEIQSRLRRAEQMLVADTNPALDQLLQRLKRAGGEYFSSVSYVDRAGNRAQIFGSGSKLPILTEAVQRQLARGGTVVQEMSDDRGVPSLFILRGVGPYDLKSGLMVAELSPLYLWRHEQPGRHNTDFYVLDQGRSVLYSSNGRDISAAVETLGRHSRSLSGNLIWNDGTADHVASYLTLATAHDLTHDWLVLADRPAVTAFHGMPGTGWILGVLAALWLGLLSFHASSTRRKSMAIAQLSDRRGLWLTREGKPSETGRGFGFLRAMGEIDRAILSNASFDRIMELVFTHAPAAVPCKFVAITQFDQSVNGGCNTLIASQGSVRSWHQAEFNELLRHAIDDAPNGYWLDLAETYPLLEPTRASGALRYLLFPIYRDGTLSAVLHFGLAKDELLTGDECELARNFADRLGVSLTAIVRAKNLYVQEYFDPITSLPNRRFCIERLCQEISRACRHQQCLAILFVNLEGFKKVNDSAGYAGGDSILHQVGHRMRVCLREQDILARFGNDEFVILLPETSGSSEAGRVAEKLITQFSEHFSYEEQIFYLDVDVGISLYPEDGQSGDVLLQRANIAMMRIKGREQGQYMFYENQMNVMAMERLSMERDLRQALQHGQLFMVYQPQIDLGNGRVSGAEALVRWNHPQRGQVPPIEFVGLAEEMHLICQLGEYVRRAVCAQYREWASRGVTPPTIALNVSSAELMRRSFAGEMMSVLNEFEVPISAIEIEVTESLLIDESGTMVETLRGLRGLGFKIAVDDFGTGYSCLSYLARLPFDVLKVDRSFVSQIGMHDGGGAIVAMIIDIAHHLGKTVVAEGAEDEHQRSFLIDHGCEVLQGFVVSRPLAAEDFVLFLQQRQVDIETSELLA